MATVIETFAPAIEQLRADLAQIEEKVVTGYTLSDAIREGASVTGQKIGGFGEHREACALSGGLIAAAAREYV